MELFDPSHKFVNAQHDVLVTIQSFRDDSLGQITHDP
jgi:hypothetical protein